MAAGRFMNFQVDDELRQAFLAACRAQDRTGSQVLRDFMRDYVRKHGQGTLPLSDPKKG
ncbi:MAG: plasmid-related protein [Pseudomonadota bacterium]